MRTKADDQRQADRHIGQKTAKAMRNSEKFRRRGRCFWLTAACFIQNAERQWGKAMPPHLNVRIKVRWIMLNAYALSEG